MELVLDYSSWCTDRVEEIGQLDFNILTCLVILKNLNFNDFNDNDK